MDGICKSQAKEIKLSQKQLKVNDTLSTKNETLRKKLLDENAKAQIGLLEKDALIDKNEIMLEKIKSTYETMTTKADIETTASLGKLELKFNECKLKLEAKIQEVKMLTDENKRLKKCIDKLEDLSFAKSNLAHKRIILLKNHKTVGF